MSIYIYLNLIYDKCIAVTTYDNYCLKHEGMLKIAIKKRLYNELLNNIDIKYDCMSIYSLINILNKYPILFYPITNFLFVSCKGDRLNMFNKCIFENNKYQQYFNDIVTFKKITIFFRHFKQIPNVNINILNDCCLYLLLCLYSLNKYNKSICKPIIRLIIYNYINSYIVCQL